ncbi:hypothetical protein [Terracidiphilus sp.]|uniref:hypothetical protein n=1 Tax=Terracidiphilus sp. TaxID=1964191 RepID=UPI003C238B15
MPKWIISLRKWILSFFSSMFSFFSGKAARSFGSLIRYLYFLRFSILLWLLPFLLCALNETGARALLSGIVTPVRCVQYLCASFFLIAAGFESLTLARIVLFHGEERFSHEPPLWLVRFFAAERKKEHQWFPRHRWVVESLAPIGSQLPTAAMFVYFFTNGGKEGVAPDQIALGLASGTLLALFFWYAICGFYYLTYQPINQSSDDEPQSATAKTLVLPRWMFFLSDSGKRGRLGDVLEYAKSPDILERVTGFFARFFPISGYKQNRRGLLYEAHYFALVSSGGFFGLYIALCPITAPMPVSFWPLVSSIFYVLGGLMFVRVAHKTVPGGAQLPAREARHLRCWKWVLGIFMLCFSLSIPVLYFIEDAERFPILALVLILIMSAGWLLGGIAFFLDRFRVPVLTLVIMTIVVPRMLHLDFGMDEHYLSIATRQSAATLPTPAEILAAKLQALPADQPLVIVTSTGGGIHAAAWTAAVLEQLEHLFHDNQMPELKSFHDHILLLSTVSGGSAGLYTYLRELDPKLNAGNPQWDRMPIEAECSSLEAVGWGLVYYDIPKSVVPVIPYFLPPSTGVDDLKQQPLSFLHIKDRTWALRRAFARNLNDAYCQTVFEQNTNLSSKFGMVLRNHVLDAHNQNEKNEAELMAGNLNPLDDSIPAFTMNTTTVEGGYRFLSANYRVIPASLSPDLFNPEPAESFLQVYGRSKLPDPPVNQNTANKYADLPLATAAQLSATFPYVSSATTFPSMNHKLGVHFVDGGYYDNDGTASAMEFLRAALDCWGDGRRVQASSSIPNPCELIKQRAGDKDHLPDHPLRIILVEIRNSPDVTPTGQTCCIAWQDIAGGNTPWNLFDQLVAPLQGFWGAGHDSITDRNRNVLLMLMGTYKGRLDLKHFVIDDRSTAPNSTATDKPLTDPLNWSLTPAQQFEVTNTATNDANCARYQQIKSCFLPGAACNESAAPLPVEHNTCRRTHP